MEAFKCDGCEKFQNGGPLLVMHQTVQSFADQGEYHFCAWSCVGEYANRRLKQAEEREVYND